MPLIKTLLSYAPLLGGLAFAVHFSDAQEDGNFTDEMLEDLLFGDDENDIPTSTPSIWSKNLNLSFGGGHSSNPLQGPHVQTQAGFGTASLDSFLLRMGKNSSVFYLYLFAEGSHYEGIPELELTGIALAQAEYSTTSPITGFGRGIRLRHTYYDMVFDMSENLDSPYSFTVQSNKSEARPFVSFPLGEKLTGTLEMAAARDVYAISSEDYGEKEFRSIVKWKGSNESAVNFSTYSRWRDYDERSQRDSSGFQLASGTLDTRTVGATVSGSRKLGESKDWEVSLSLFANETGDNAGGYYDYRTLGSRMGLEYETENWTFSASASGSESKYDVRPVLDSNWMPTGKVFSRQSWETELSIERKISKDWRLYAKWNEGADQSNDPSYEYEATVISAGVKWSH